MAVNPKKKLVNKIAKDAGGNKYNERRVQIILASLSKMSSKASAAEAAGISYKSFQHWYRTYPEFKRRVDEVLEDANSRGKTIAIQAIFAKMDTQWQAAAWWLERNFPNEFGRKDRVDMDISEKKLVFTIGNNDPSALLQDNPMVNFVDKKKLKEIVDQGKKTLKEDSTIEEESTEVVDEWFKELEDPRFDSDSDEKESADEE